MNVDQIVTQHREAVSAGGTLPRQHRPVGQPEHQCTQFVIVAAGLIGVDPSAYAVQFLAVEATTDPTNGELPHECVGTPQLSSHGSRLTNPGPQKGPATPTCGKHSPLWTTPNPTSCRASASRPRLSAPRPPSRDLALPVADTPYMQRKVSTENARSRGRGGAGGTGGGDGGAGLVAGYAVAVSVQVVDVVADHPDRPADVGGTVATATRAVDVAGDRDAAAVVRVAL